jgi:hypothetical protein
MRIAAGILSLIFLYVIYSRVQRARKIKQCFANFSVGDFFTPHESYISADLHSAIAIDKRNHLLGFQNEYGQCNFYDERYIINSQIIINEQTYQYRPFISVWGNYLIGKWVGGDKIGEIAALTSRVRVDKQINSIKLKVTVADFANPNHTITFLRGRGSRSQQERAMKQVEYWDSLVKIFLHMDDRDGTT